MAAKCRWSRILRNEASTSAVRPPMPTSPSMPEPQRYGTTSNCQVSGVCGESGWPDWADTSDAHNVKPATTPTTKARVVMFLSSHRSAPETAPHRLLVGQEARQRGVGFAVCDFRAEHVCFRSRATRVGVRAVRHEAHVYLRGGQQLSSEVIGVARAFQLEVRALDRGRGLCLGELRAEIGGPLLCGGFFDGMLTL